MAKYKRPFRLTLPEPMGKQLEDLADERDMPIDAFLSELVLLGLQSLKYPPSGPPDPFRGGVDPSEDEFGA